MISMDNYEIFKNKYLQQPITLLTKENLELLEKHCERQVRHEVGQRLREHEIVLELLYKYKELETDKQKTIEKLEELLKEIKQDGICGYDRDILEILKIVKGEKDE